MSEMRGVEAAVGWLMEPLQDIAGSLRIIADATLPGQPQPEPESEVMPDEGPDDRTVRAQGPDVATGSPPDAPNEPGKWMAPRVEGYNTKDVISVMRSWWLLDDPRPSEAGAGSPEGWDRFGERVSLRCPFGCAIKFEGLVGVWTCCPTCRGRFLFRVPLFPPTPEETEEPREDGSSEDVELPESGIVGYSIEPANASTVVEAQLPEWPWLAELLSAAEYAGWLQRCDPRAEDRYGRARAEAARRLAPREVKAAVVAYEGPDAKLAHRIEVHYEGGLILRSDQLGYAHAKRLLAFLREQGVIR